MALRSGGAVEASLSVYLETLATTLGSREQLAIAEFAEVGPGKYCSPRCPKHLEPLSL